MSERRHHRSLGEKASLLANGLAVLVNLEDDVVGAVRQVLRVDQAVAGRVNPGGDEPPVDQQVDFRRLLQEDLERSALQRQLVLPRIELGFDAGAGDAAAADQVGSRSPEDAAAVSPAFAVCLEDKAVDRQADVR